MRSLVLLLLPALLACPQPLPSPADAGLDGGADAPAPGAACAPLPRFEENVSACAPLATDYRPRDAMSANDTWPACISDSNVFTPINANISTVARVAAFEDIAALLWERAEAPSATDFVDARVLYAVDQGLDSRVQRREDIHYAAAPMPCSTAGIPDQYPDRCAGPTKLLPVLNAAFLAGGQGESPRVNAARIEAALLWFLYLSSLSEVMSCTQRPQDCDSSWAYLAGGGPREQPLGLARVVRALGVETSERAYDAVLAVRCWRALDNQTGVAMDLARRDLARDQLDRALLRGVALVVRQKVTEVPCSTGSVQEARLAFLNTLAPWLDRAARERDPVMANQLQTQLSATTAAGLDVTAATAALDGLFACP
jgi:hypothetical protein